MAAQTESFSTPDWMPSIPRPVQLPRPRVRGLALPVLPSWPLLAQLGGGAATLSGVYLRFGLAVMLIVGGLALVLMGMLREAGKI